MKVAAYIRVSTEDQSTENQRADIEALAARYGLVIDRWYTEVESAAKKRPVYESMMADAEAHRFGVLLTWSIDRIGRSMVGTVAAITRLHEMGLRVVSHREAWLDQPGPTRPLLLAIFSWIAEQEREQLIARTRAGMDKARKLGTKSGMAIGRPRKVTTGLDSAVAAVASGSSVRAAARAHGVSITTLQRRVGTTRKAPETSAT